MVAPDNRELRADTELAAFINGLKGRQAGPRVSKNLFHDARLGNLGGVVCRPMQWGTRKLQPGDKISPEDALKLTLQRRQGLESGQTVKFYTSPPGDQDLAAVAALGTKADEVDELLGQFGGVTLEALQTGGVVYPAGVRLPAELVMKWPAKNRLALKNTGRVAFFKEEPSEDLQRTLQETEEAALSSLLE